VIIEIKNKKFKMKEIHISNKDLSRVKTLLDSLQINIESLGKESVSSIAMYIRSTSDIPLNWNDIRTSSVVVQEIVTFVLPKSTQTLTNIVLEKAKKPKIGFLG